MPKLLVTAHYEKKLALFKIAHPKLINTYIKTISLLAKNPGHPSLRLHKLKGELSDFYSVSINMKYRIILDFLVQGDQILLIDISGHGEIYR